MISFSNHQLNLSEFNAADIQRMTSHSIFVQMPFVYECIWVMIKDFFCQTNHFEAYRCLYTLFDPMATQWGQIDAWLTLKILAGDGYKNNFQIDRNDNSPQATVELNLHISPSIKDLKITVPFLVFNRINELIDADYENR